MVQDSNRDRNSPKAMALGLNLRQIRLSAYPRTNEPNGAKPRLTAKKPWLAPKRLICNQGIGVGLKQII